MHGAGDQSPELFRMSLDVAPVTDAELRRLVSPLARSIDGSGVSFSAPRAGASETSLVRLAPGPSEAARRAFAQNMPTATRVADELLLALPSTGSRRKPATSALLNAFSLLVVHDMVRLHVDTEARSSDRVCADAGSVAAGTCRARLAPLASALPRETGRNARLRAPLNAQTHWLDGSVIYGANDAESTLQRVGRGGLLTLDRSRWAAREAPIQVVALVEMFIREHNWRASLVAKARGASSNANTDAVNATVVEGTDDESLFREARRLVIGSLQRIASEEWLPTLLGEPLPSYRALAVGEVITEEQRIAAARFGFDQLDPSQVSHDVFFVNCFSNVFKNEFGKYFRKNTFSKFHLFYFYFKLFIFFISIDW